MSESTLQTLENYSYRYDNQKCSFEGPATPETSTTTTVMIGKEAGKPHHLNHLVFTGQRQRKLGVSKSRAQLLNKAARHGTIASMGLKVTAMTSGVWTVTGAQEHKIPMSVTEEMERRWRPDADYFE